MFRFIFEGVLLQPWGLLMGALSEFSEIIVKYVIKGCGAGRRDLEVFRGKKATNLSDAKLILLPFHLKETVSGWKGGKFKKKSN